MRSDSCVSAALLFTPSDHTGVSRRTGLRGGTSPDCQKKLAEVLKFLVRLHTQGCEEQSLHGGVFGKEEPTVPRHFGCSPTSSLWSRSPYSAAQ